MPRPSHSTLFRHLNNVWRGVLNYEAPHYAVFLQPPVSSSLFGPACSRTPSVYVPSLMSETNFHTHTEPQAKL
jgi:hypothetical protein